MTIEELVSGMANPIKDKSHPLYGFDVYGCYDVIIDFTDESGHSDFAVLKKRKKRKERKGIKLCY